MRITKFGKYAPRVFKAVCFTLLLLTASAAVWAQSQNWWVLPSTGPAERGKIDELKMAKNVYLNVTFETGPGQITSTTEQSDIRKNVVDAFKAHKGLTIVSNPLQADFAVIVRTTMSVAGAETERPPNFSVALDPDDEISVEVTVLVAGAKLPTGGTFKPRSVWQVSSPNVQLEAGAAARFVVDGFLWELKKVREGKK